MLKLPMHLSQLVKALTLLLCAVIGVNGALAQNYPTKRVSILTTGTGGGSDFVARVVASELTETLGQPVIVENRAGGNALNIAVANAAPDGHTLLVVGGTLWTGPLFESAPYDTLRDFAPITTLTTAPNLLIVNPSLPARTVAEFIALARAKPGELNYSSGAAGSSGYVGAELFKHMAKVNLVGIIYPGPTQAPIDLVAGTIQLTFGQGATYVNLVKAGKLRALGVGGARPSTLFPDLPLISATVPGYVSESLLTLWAPAKTPEAAISRLNLETVRALAKPDVRDKLLKTGQEPVGGSPQQLRDYVKSEVSRLGEVIKSAGLKPGN